VAFDTHVSLEYPDWLCRTKQDDTIAYANCDDVCLNTPYKHELVFPQLDELIERYRDLDVLSFWLDLCWMPLEGCYYDFCRWELRREYGHDLYQASDADRFASLRRSVHDFIAESKCFAKERDPALLVSRNQVWLSHRTLYENADPNMIRVGEYDEL
jgi:hypothetical protein